MRKVIVTMASGREIVTRVDDGGRGLRRRWTEGTRFWWNLEWEKDKKVKSGKKSGDWIGLLASSITDTHSSC